MSENKISRRDFIKLLSLIPASISVKPLANLALPSSNIQPHIIILVYDAWAARNTSLYGYSRETMPNLERFAQKSLVYHRHYSAGNFTVPGTASLLTGVYPWKHRALSLGGRIKHEFQEKQIFNVFSKNYTTVGYAQNKYADLFLYQSENGLKNHISNHQFNLNRRLVYDLPIFKNDPYLAFSSFDDNIFQKGLGFDGSLFFGPLFRSMTLRQRLLNQINNSGKFYDDLLPDSTEQFLLSNVIDGAIGILKELKEPSLVYLHFFPPHDPYRPTNEYKEYFSKSPETLVKKPIHILSEEKNNYGLLKARNQTYDEYLASWDSEAARLYQYIEQSGLRNNSYIFLTSDHGEMFERGELSHMTPLLNQPVVHIPLIVSKPGLDNRIDIHTTTSAVDLLPTIANIAGFSKPEWADGEILPEVESQYQPNRSVFSLEAKKNAAFAPLKDYSISLTKNNKRLMHYQYGTERILEFYDLDTDPEETIDLYSSSPAASLEMESELLDKISEITLPGKK